VGNASAFVLLALIIVLAITLISTIPEDVVAPWSGRMLWLGLLIVLAILFFPVRWALRRPWTVVAETAGNYDLPAEKWTGKRRMASLRCVGRLGRGRSGGRERGQT